MLVGNKLDLIDDDESQMATPFSQVRTFAAAQRTPYVLLCARDTEKVKLIFKQLIYSTSAVLPSQFERLKKRRESLPVNTVHRGSHQFDPADFERIQRAASYSDKQNSGKKGENHRCVLM